MTKRSRRVRIGHTVQMMDHFGVSISVSFVTDQVTFYSVDGKVQLSDHKSLDDAEVWLNGFCVGAGYRVEHGTGDPVPIKAKRK